MVLPSKSYILKPKPAGYKNCYLGQGTFVIMVLCSKFAFWVNLHHILWVVRVSGVSIVIEGVKGRYWSQISRRKLNNSIWEFLPFTLIHQRLWLYYTFLDYLTRIKTLYLLLLFFWLSVKDTSMYLCTMYICTHK